MKANNTEQPDKAKPEPKPDPVPEPEPEPMPTPEPIACPYCGSTNITAHLGFAECNECGNTWSY